MVEGRTEIKKSFLSGITRRVQFQIVDKETGLGFQPSTLVMSVYDVNTPHNQRYPAVFSVTTPDPIQPVIALTSTIVNGQNDTDVSAFVDVQGNVDLYLDVDDTAIAVPAVLITVPYQRRVLFTWTWGSPPKTGKHEIWLAITPDRESVAT